MNIKIALEMTKQIIEQCLSTDFDLTNEHFLHVLKHSAEILNIGCEDGYDCGCSQRLEIYRDVMVGIDKIKSKKKEDNYCHCKYPQFCPICGKEFMPEENLKYN